MPSPARLCSGLRYASAAHDFTVKVDATGLSPDTRYYYRFKHDDTDGTSFSDIGAFRTASSPSGAADVRFTYTGDADGTRNAGGVPAYNEFETLRADCLEGGAFFVFDGDTIYSDSRFRSGGPATTLAEYQATHRENRGYANLRALLASTSVYATMDDLEIVNDFDAQTGDPARYAAGRNPVEAHEPTEVRQPQVAVPRPDDVVDRVLWRTVLSRPGVELHLSISAWRAGAKQEPARATRSRRPGHARPDQGYRSGPLAATRVLERSNSAGRRMLRGARCAFRTGVAHHVQALAVLSMPFGSAANVRGVAPAPG